MTKYVLGFAFDSMPTGFHNPKVVLVRKNRPKNQISLLNGVGGKIERGEQPSEAMVREFREETGLFSSPSDWFYFCAMKFKDVEVYCFTSIRSHCGEARSVTDEVVYVLPTSIVFQRPRMSNLDWLIPMALSYLAQPFRPVKISTA